MTRRMRLLVAAAVVALALPALAQERVAALTDSEVHALAGNVNSQPVGAMATAAWVVIAIVIAAVVYFNWKK